MRLRTFVLGVIAALAVASTAGGSVTSNSTSSETTTTTTSLRSSLTSVVSDKLYAYRGGIPLYSNRERYFL